jgi:hypothetical protein
MIIIRLRSGLGNQMFQYAFFKQMQKWYGEDNVKIDISTFHWKAHNGLELDRIFEIDLKKDSIPKSVALKYADVGYKFHHRLLRRLRGTKHRSYAFWKDLKFEDYKNLEDIYLEGYWNDEKYFEEIKDQIRKLYQFKIELNEKEQRYLNKILSVNSVAIHVRRGDYKKFPKTFPMCTPDYYGNAIELLSASNPNLKYFVFSDDLEWCKKELFFLTDAVFVENTVQERAFVDMLLMSKCKHNIIANSSFSWWSAWLNNNPQKIVIYPESVFRTYDSMPKEWKCLY